MAESHFAGIIITQMGEDGTEYLVVEYDSGNGTQVKFPGGTNNGHPNETVLETLKRECEEETGLIPEFPSCVSPIFVGTVGGDGGGKHRKYFFTVDISQCRGSVRTSPKVDDGDKLSPPFWRTKKELLVHVKDGGLFWSHRPALHNA